MRIEKKVLNDALRVLGKVVCQTSPVELLPFPIVYIVVVYVRLNSGTKNH